MTRLADVIVPAVFNPYVIKETMMQSALFRSGIIASDPQIDALAKGPSNYFNMPFWNDLTGRSNIGSDDPAVKSTAKKIGAGKDMAVKHFRNDSWTAMDLAGLMAGSDPMGAIANLVGGYWARDMQTTLIKTLDGVIADNVAGNAGDMVLNVATDAVGVPTAAEKIGPNVVLAAKQTMGDAAKNLTAIVMHSAVYTELQKQNVIIYNAAASADVGFGTYLGYTIVIDDGCPAVMGTNRITYTSYLFGSGAIGYGEGNPKVPTAVTRNEDAGNGEGQETLYQRKHFILHPRGIAWTNSSMAGVSPTDAELGNVANWNRVYERKAVKFVAIKTNG
jgi:hypothetical protein